MKPALLLLFVVFLLPIRARAEADEPAFDCGAAIQSTILGIERVHYSRKPLDDELSARWLRGFIQLLDPRRMYFLEKDFARFRRHENELDDMARRGDFRFAIRVREVYRKRTAQAAAYAEEFLGTESQFDRDDELPGRYEAFAPDRAELRERWRRRIHLERLIEKAHNRPADEAQNQLRERYRRIARQAQELTDERLCEIYLNGLVRLYDPHTEYYSRSTYWRFFSRRLKTFGLGVSLTNLNGRYIIASHLPRSERPVRTEIRGWELIAIRRIGGPTHDVVEVHEHDLAQLIFGHDGPLGSDSEVVLELLHPVTKQRLSLTWPRYSNF
jgi:carboxyl-terminal processing protease